MPDIQHYRNKQLRELINTTGVYALCDLDGVPIYVGQSTDGIRNRVRRHLTSARSDVIANRLVDVWEVAFVWGWTAESKMDISALESKLYKEMDDVSALMNSQLPRHKYDPNIAVPEKCVVQVLPNDEIERRLQPKYRFGRQAHQLNLLLDYILEIKSNTEMKRSLGVHFDRLEKYHRQYQAASKL